MRTDHGSFGVVSSWSLLPFSMGRKEVVTLLSPGSCREIHWFGSDRDADGPNWRQDPSTNNTIYHVALRPDSACPPIPPPDGPPWELRGNNGDLRVHLQVFMEPAMAQSRSKVVGVVGFPGGAAFLHLRLAADGDLQLDEAATTLIADELGIPRASVVRISSDYVVGQTFLLRGEREDLFNRLEVSFLPSQQ
jgi:hypothetical protein